MHKDAPRITRREFLSFVGGVVVFFAAGGSAPARAAPPADAKAELPGELSAWLRVGPDGRVTIFSPTPEVGQGLRTCLAQLAAEELSLPVSTIEVVLGDTDRVPPDPGVCAGEAIALIGPRVQQAAARARELLLDIAARTMEVERDRLTWRDGRALLTSDPSRSLSIGELVRGQPLSSAIGDAPLKPIAERAIVGEPVRRLDGPGYVRGRARYAADIRLPDLAYARMLTPPAVGARLVTAQTRAAAAQPGVIAVVQDEDFVGVVAARPDIADRALLAIQATWSEPDRPSTGSLYQDLRRSAKLDQQLGSKGDVEAALAGARHGFSASYRLPFAAHAHLEPHCAVAEPKGDRIVIYVSTERPFVHRDAVAQSLGLSPGRLRVIVTAVGGAFGGKSDPDISVRAARLAQSVRRPVMLTQSRDQEMVANAFSPAAVVDVRAGVDENGKIVAWDCDALNCGGVGAIPPYDFPNQRLRLYRCASPLPQGPSRALGNPANTFAREVHLDNVAASLGLDPIELRLDHLSDDQRLPRVIKTVAERYGWRARRPPTGQGVGFALAVHGATCAAVIAEADADAASGRVSVRRVWVAQDSGLVINPDNARNQIEGAVTMGTSLALKEAVRYELGRILSRTFASYPIATFRDAPETEIVLVPNSELPPQGEGTASFCAVAPAIANAVFDATGKRLRDLPLWPDVVRSAK
ncbi:MAG: molybdopterin cofactor-binding domain-containing protein [Armatimonadota bacterium]